MKTRVNKLKKEQALNNKIMLISILVFGSILFIAAGKNIGQGAALKSDFSSNTIETVKMSETNSCNSEHIIYNYLVPLNVTFERIKINRLETGKLNQKVYDNSQVAYHLALYALSNEEEPELFIEDIMAQIDVQRTTFKLETNTRTSVSVNPYLNKLYKEKMAKIYAEIEMEKSFENNLAAENEVNLELEGWMTADNFWRYSAKEEENWNKSLTAMLDAKIEAVDKEIEAERLLKSYLTLDTEEPLNVESWMTGEANNNQYEVPKNDFLASLVEVKMNETYELIELIRKTKCCGKPEIEEPLALENWMVSEKCWCPDKRPAKHWYNESFALNSEK